MRQDTYDRRVAEAPYNAVLGVDDVEDPFSPAGARHRVTVTRSLRDDPLGRLRARKQIGASDFEAGRAWQALYEAAEVGRVGAIDPTRVVVDGGRIAEPLTDRQRRAAQTLARIDRALGPVGASLVRLILGQGKSLTDVAISRGMGDASGVPRADREFLTRRLQECLDTIAGVLGLATDLSR